MNEMTLFFLIVIYFLIISELPSLFALRTLRTTFTASRFILTQICHPGKC